MKNMLRSTAAWLNEKVATKRTPPPALVAVDQEQALEVQPQVEFKAPVLPLTAPVVVPPVAPQPEVTTEPPQFTAKLILSLKGSIFYATCPHCEATFNLQSRLADARFKRLFATTGMTCAKCDNGVQMPTQEDLRLVKRS